MELFIVITKVEKYYRIVNICLKAGTLEHLFGFGSNLAQLWLAMGEKFSVLKKLKRLNIIGWHPFFSFPDLNQQNQFFKNVPKCPLVFFCPSWAITMSNHHQNLEHHAICVNRQANFCKDLLYCLQRVRYPKNGQYLLVSPLLEGSGLTLS